MVKIMEKITISLKNFFGLFTNIFIENGLMSTSSSWQKFDISEKS